MDGLFPLLFYAALFYLMMRFGCGAHMVHGKHGKNDSSEDSNTKHIDPVCGMTVPMDEGYGKMHGGQLYRFCSRKCLDKFDIDADPYLEHHNG